MTPEHLSLKAKVQAELEALRATFLMRRPFLAMVSLRLDLIAVVDDRVQTAATNGRCIYFDARFFMASTPQKQEFVFAHEVWHGALGHFSRAQGRHAQLWNLATDHEINALLAVDGFPLPDDAVHFPDMVGMNAEEVYARLLQEGCMEQHRFDLHLTGLALPEDDIGPLRDPDFRVTERPPSILEADTLLIASVRATEARHSHIPGQVKMRAEALTRAKIDWRSVLAQFVQNAAAKQYSWSRPQRRHLHRGLYLPSRRGFGFRLVVAIDVSGSVFNLAADFLSELRAIVATTGVEAVELMVFDTMIRHRQTMAPDTDVAKILAGAKGGGGTDFRPVFEAMEDEGSAVLILLTDGYGEAPELAPDYPVLWALTATGRCPVDWGACLHARQGPSKAAKGADLKRSILARRARGASVATH